LYALHQCGAFFVTRAKAPLDARRVYSAAADRSTGVICDQRNRRLTPMGTGGVLLLNQTVPRICCSRA
jgi:hypothetical protein